MAGRKLVDCERFDARSFIISSMRRASLFPTARSHLSSAHLKASAVFKSRLQSCQRQLVDGSSLSSPKFLNAAGLAFPCRVAAFELSRAF